MVIDLKGSDYTLQQALDMAKENDVIYLDNKVYFEKVYIRKPDLTLIGREHSSIGFNVSNGTIRPIEDGGNGVRTYGTTGSASVTVCRGADRFTAKNITFFNSFNREGKANGQAVAFKAEISNLYMENCRFLSEQDTLYIDYGKENKIKDCYIEGDVDFIFGSADCVFENCEIVGKGKGKYVYFTAPDTYMSNLYGFVFLGCRFQAVEGAFNVLGRAWYPSGALEKVYPKACFIECVFFGDIELDLILMHQGDPRVYSLKAYRCKVKEEEWNLGNCEEEILLVRG